MTRLTLTVDCFPSCRLCKRDFVRSGPYNRAILFVKCPEINSKMASDRGVYIRKSRCREGLWAWDVSERMEVEVKHHTNDDVQWHLEIYVSSVTQNLLPSD